MIYKNIQHQLRKNNFIFKNFKVLDSTMEKTKELIDNYKSNFLVLSDEQTKGKGRRGSIWYSPSGNIYISLGFKNLIDIKNHFIFNAATVLSISESIDSICNLNSNIKWPNDILVNGKKISGVIVELIKSNNMNYIILGVGINVEKSPNILNYPTTCTKELNSKINKIEILELFLKNFFNYLDNIYNHQYKYILDKFRKKLLYLNKKIYLEENNISFLEGKFIDINLDGSMVININGVRKNLYSARILNDNY